MVRSLTRHGMPKPFAMLVAALLALYFVPFGALPAQAAVVGGFEIEGNLVDDTAADPPIDWFDLGPGSPGFGTGVDNTTAEGQDTTTFSGSSKEYVDAGKAGGWPAWTFGTGNAAGKSDYGRWATYDFVDASNHVWFFLGFDRGFGTGTAKYVFELNQITQALTTNPNPVRSQGDLRLVVWDQGNGVVTLTGDQHNDDVGLYVWDDPDQGSGGVAEDTDDDGAWVKNTTSGVFAGASNTGETPVAVPAWWTSGNVTAGTLTKDKFLEFGIDLTSFGAVLGCPSSGFTAVNSRSITGTGDPGTLVDYLAAIPVTIPSSCASLFIRKFQGDGTTPLGGATFRIEPNPLPVGTPGRPSDNFLTIFDDSGPNTTVEAGTNYDDPDATAGLITLPAVVPGVQYSITEVSAPDGWIKDNSVVLKTPVAFGTSETASNTASFTNRRGSVTFYKDYEGADPSTGASFTLTRDNDDADALYDNGTVQVTDNGANDSAAAMGTITVDPLEAGSWKLVETSVPTGWLVDTDEVLFTVPDAQGNRNVTLTNPTMTDPRATYPLQVHKSGVVPGQADVDVQGAVFKLWRDTNGTAGLQKATDTEAGTCTTGVNGNCSVTGQPWGFNYYWEEISVPAPWNLPNVTVQGPVFLNADGTTDPSGATQFNDPKSKIVTQATNGSLPNATISDTATLSGVNDNAAGTVTFDLYYTGQTEPTTASCTAGNLVQAGIPATAAVDGPGDYTTGPVSVDHAGYYAWVAHYSGDSNGNRAVSGACDDTGETSLVTGAEPGITTVVPNSTVTLTGEPTVLTDKATLSGATANAAGSITFQLFGPFTSDPGPGDCIASGPGENLVDTVGSVETFSGNGDYHSLGVTVSQVGYYSWIATYDSTTDDNADATHPCGQESETVLVNPAEPVITTDAQQDSVTLSTEPTYLTDEATLSGSTADATGDITFALYGPFGSDPGPEDCVATGENANLVATVGPVVAFSGDGTYTSEPVEVKLAGYYTWVATYSGDDNNLEASHSCGQAVETTLVNPARPTITTQVPEPSVLLGQSGTDLTDTATLSGGTTDPAVSGEIEFVLYGPFDSAPSDESCTEGAIYQDAAEVNPQSVVVDHGNGAYDSAAVRVTKAGYYTWVATYSGDDNNESATHACGLESETVHVTPRQPVIETQISATQLVLNGGSVSFSDSATVSNATDDVSGSITFRLFGPGTSVEAACNGASAVQGSAVAVDGNGSYQGPTVTVSTPGYYSWVATFNPAEGDGNNLSATHACGQASETVQVFSGSNPTLTKIANPPSGSVVQPSDNITYSVTVGNTGDVAIDDGVVTDTLPPYVTVNTASVTASGGTYSAGTDITKSAGTIRWVVDLAPGETRTFTYNVTVNFNAPELSTLVNTAEFFGLKATTTHRVPEGDLTIVKTVSPVAGGGTVVEFGDTLTYTLTVTATGTLNQTNVVVTDYLPGRDPARPASGKTTYVAGSATCIGAGTCTVTGPGADGLISWGLGSMAAGSTRQVTFKVTINDVAGDPGDVIAVDILNAGAVASTETPKTPSNEVVTPVTKVLPVKIGKPPAAPEVLPRTGSAVPIGPLTSTAIALLGLGLLLVAATRRRGAHRRG